MLARRALAAVAAKTLMVGHSLACVHPTEVARSLYALKKTRASTGPAPHLRQLKVRGVSDRWRWPSVICATERPDDCPTLGTLCRFGVGGTTGPVTIETG